MHVPFHFKIQADAGLGVRAHLAIGHSHVGGVGGVALEGGCIGKGGVQHQVCVGRGQAVDVHMHLHKARDLPCQALQSGFDVRLDLCLFGGRKLVLELPENDMLDHKNTSCVFSIVTEKCRRCNAF